MMSETDFHDRKRFGRSPPLVGGFLMWLIVFVAGLGVLWVGSHRAVDHDIHAIELADGEFIHGTDLVCTPESDGLVCEVSVSGEVLSVQTQPTDPNGRLDSFSSCAAVYAEIELECENAYVTSSYWGQGARIFDQSFADAVAADSSVTSNWRNVFLGRSEGLVIKTISAWGAIAWFTATATTITMQYFRVCKTKPRSSPSKSPNFWSIIKHPSIYMSPLYVVALPVSVWVALVSSFPFDYFD